MCDKRIIIIAGPTASGKTAYAVETALRVGGEIISADSMQVYRHMDIGTATPSVDEMQGVKHWLISEVNPNEEFNVSIFCEKAKGYIADIQARGKTPIICGGTGFYINALLYENSFGETDLALREELTKFTEAHGAKALHERLSTVDHKYAETVHPNNVRKVVRALEFYEITGTLFSEHNAAEKQRQSAYEAEIFILTMDREKLYERINLRVDKMVENGLVEEVRALLEMGYSPALPAMQGLGYKEIVQHLKVTNCLPLREAIDEVKQGSRRYAKRQLTWFRHQLKGTWIEVE